VLVGSCLVAVASVFFVGYRLGARRTVVASQPQFAHDDGSDRVERELRALRASNAELERRLDKVAIALDEDGRRRPVQHVERAEKSEDKDPAPTSPEAVSAMNAGGDVISRAVAAGVWTDRDRNQMRGVLATAPNEAKKALVQQLIALINADKVKVNIVGPPF
jgi:hypothetical protein